MNFCLRFASLLILIGLMLLAGPALAQVSGVGVYAETTCDGIEVDIHVTLTVYGPIEDGIVGWVVEREVLGMCVDPVDVNEVQPMPTAIGSHEFVVHHAPVVPFRKPIYYVWAVDGDGERHFINWPSRTNFAQGNCQPAPAARGMVTEYHGNLYVEVCPDECWWELSYFDGGYPPDMPLGATVDIYGEIQAGMEGPYVYTMSWEYAASECLVVPNEEHSWGSLKASYR